MNRSNSRLPMGVAVLILMAVLAYFGWQHFNASEKPTMESGPVAASPVEPPVVADPQPAAPGAPASPEVAAIENPIDALATSAPAVDAAPLPALNGSDAAVSNHLSALLGRKSVLTFLQLDGFVRRAVATVDNLARSQASSKLWPVNPTPQRFITQPGGGAGGNVIAAANSQRYAPLVQMVESVDTAKAVAVYRALYPLFQQAYEELGFPNGYFNDRLVQVLDHLIATPVPSEPLAVSLVEVKGTVPSLRPWVRYEYVDPDLEAMSAGRKMLLRSGADHQRRLQAKLSEIRRQVAKP